ncbi:MAG: vWA domain-containing protein, partial [Planctomycetota bacterium]
MNLLSPLLGAALLAATLVPLVALYFLRLRRTRRVVSSTLPWVRRTDDLRANAPFQRLRATPLLLLQIALLGLLALAAAQPVLRGLGSRGGRVILLVDCSASMQTLDGDGGVSRLEQARRAAIARAEALQGGGLFALAAPEIMVISFASGAEVRTSFTGSLPRVREAIERIAPTDERTRLGPALELARAHQAGAVSESDGAPRGEATIELFSDGRIGDAGEVALRGSERLGWTRVGSEATLNAGLAAVGLERSVDDPGQVAAFAGLRNFAGLAATRSVEVLADGAPIATTPAPVEVPPRRVVNGAGVVGERRLVFPPFSSPTERLMEVRTQPGDAFPVDDRAFVSLRAARTLSLALVGADESLAALLAALGPKALVRLDRAAAEAAIAKDPRWAEGFDAVISVGRAPGGLSRGRWLHFGAPPALPGLNPFGEPGRDYATAVRGDHPVMRQCNVNELVAQRVNRVAAESAWMPLIEGSRGPRALAG